MQVIRDLYKLKKPENGVALTIGNFDGVHLGHQALLRKVVDLSAEKKLVPAALTFEPHPIRVLRPEKAPKRICTPEHKIELINKVGIELIFVIGFSFEFSQITAEEFVSFILNRSIGIKELVIGYDYSFGKNREGNIDFLRESGKKAGFNVHVIDPVNVNGITVSSSKIREAVSSGDMRLSTALLGHYYQIRGVVVHGKKRGVGLLGFPTANLNLYYEELFPKVGVYVVQVIADSVCYGGVLNIGYKPTFNEETLNAETHILDYSGGELYGRDIKLNLIERIRDEKKFGSVEELKESIKNDIVFAQKILKDEKNLIQTCNEG
jgi:riboflavin kinase/FMN adenylyltransferase